jgi:hypothetical protein
VIAETSSHSDKQAQRLLRLYHLYRLSVGITLVLLISSNMDNRLLTSANDDLLRSGSWLYLVLNILLVVFFENTRRPAQLFSLALLDVLLLCGLFYAGGGVASAIGNLLIVSVAIGNTLLRRRIGLLIAAVARNRHRRREFPVERQSSRQSQRLFAGQHPRRPVFCRSIAGARPGATPGSQRNAGGAEGQ